MRAALVIALCASGCFSDRGLAIEVDVGDTGATSVTLYVGTRPCDGGDTNIVCDGGIAPLGAAGVHLGVKDSNVWYYDSDKLVPYSAPVSSGKATFHLQVEAATTTVTTLPIVIAVGSSGQGMPPMGVATLNGVVVPANTARIVTTTLLHAADIRSTDPVAGERVQEWLTKTDMGTDMSTHSCVVVEHSSGPDDFVVPFDDPDCDAIQPECDPAAYHGSSATSGGDLHPACVTPTAGVCVVGGRSCTDDLSPSTTACMPLVHRICVPDQLCKCASADSYEQCTMDQIAADMLKVPHIECDVLVAPGGTVCRVESDKIGPVTHFSGGCRQPTTSELVLDKIASGAPSHTFAGAQVELSSSSGSCQFSVKFTGGMHQMATGMNETSYGQIELAPNQKDRDPVVMPMIFHFMPTRLPGCPPTPAPIPTLCHLVEVPDDSMWSCAP